MDSDRDGWRRRDRDRDEWRRRNGVRAIIQEDQSAEFITGGSCLIIDTRDVRLSSPLQGLFAIEIHDNALSSTNIFAVRPQLIQRVNGYEDKPPGEALSHPASRPFWWPEMHGDTPTLVDLKLRFQGRVFLHYEFVAYRSERDMTVTKSQVNRTRCD